MQPLATLFILIIFYSAAMGQQGDETPMPAEQQVGFIHHLMRQNNHHQVSMEIDRLDLQKLDDKWQDSLIFLKGWSAYWQKDLDTAIVYLLKSRPEHHFYSRSRFYASICATSLSDYQRSDSILLTSHIEGPVYQHLRDFQLAGNALLRHDLGTYDSLRERLSASTHYALEEPGKNLDMLAEELHNYKPGNRFVAAGLSAVIPGLGKVYAGKHGEGVSTLLVTGMLGAMAYENYSKAGPANWKTLAAGSIFATYYIGNIWGSYFSVQMQNQQFYDRLHNQIQIHMHVPLRTIF